MLKKEMLIMRAVALGKNMYMHTRKEVKLPMRGRMMEFFSKYGAEMAASMLSLTQDIDSYRYYLSMKEKR